MNERRWIWLSLLMLAAVGVIIDLELQAPRPLPVEAPAVAEVPVATPAPVFEVPATPAPAPSATPSVVDPGLVLAPRIHFDRSGLLWEEQIKRILALQIPDSQKAALLFSLLRNVPEEAYSTVTEQAVEFLRDPDYQNVAAPLLVSPDTHGMVMSVLFSDLMERPDTITLPMLLTIARTPTHPFAQSARDNLNLLLGQDYQSDWGAWENAVRQHLATEK